MAGAEVRAAAKASPMRDGETRMIVTSLKHACLV